MVSQRNLYFGQEWNLSCALVTAHLNTVHKLVVLCTLSSRSFWETEWYSFKVPPATGLALFFGAFTEPEPTPFKGHFNEITLSVIYQPLCEIFCLFILFMGFKTDAGKDWRQEEKGTIEDEIVGWHHQLNGHEFDQTPGDSEGQGSLACYSPWGRRVGHD